MKPYFEQSDTTIYCGDNREILPTLLEESIGLAFLDPPYNVGYTYDVYRDNLDDEDYFEWQLFLAQECERLLKKNTSFLYLNYPEFAARMFWAIPEVCDLAQYEWVNWIYNTHTGGKPLRKASRAWIWMSKGVPFVDESALCGGYRNPDDKRVAKLIAQGKSPLAYDWWLIEQIKNVSLEKVEHPCQIPLEKAMRWILATTREGDTVLDPFLGSGTTALAAKKLNRKCIGIELSPAYCDEAIKRIESCSPSLSFAVNQ